MLEAVNLCFCLFYFCAGFWHICFVTEMVPGQIPLKNYPVFKWWSCKLNITLRIKQCFIHCHIKCLNGSRCYMLAFKRLQIFIINHHELNYTEQRPYLWWLQKDIHYISQMLLWERTDMLTKWQGILTILAHNKRIFVGSFFDDLTLKCAWDHRLVRKHKNT